MKKSELDELYHLLRACSNNQDVNAKDATSAIVGLTRHLLGGGDYLALIQWCAFYGEHFLLNPIHAALIERFGAGWKPKGQLVEVGAGLGWLSRGLAIKLGVGYVTVDKRPWTGIDLLIDVETPGGMKELLESLNDGDLIIMSEFLHCTDDPEFILHSLRKYDRLIIEYMPVYDNYKNSYNTQLGRYGGNPLTDDQINKLYGGKPGFSFNFQPHAMNFLNAEKASVKKPSINPKLKLVQSRTLTNESEYERQKKEM